jgi:septin family protein
MKQSGYNIFVTGDSGTGRSSFTSSLAEEFAKKKEVQKIGYMYIILKIKISLKH